MTKSKATPGSKPPAEQTPTVTTIEDYLRAVIADQTVGGRTFPQSAAAVLLELRPDVAERCWQGNRQEIVYHAEKDAWVFLYYVVSQWDRR